MFTENLWLLRFSCQETGLQTTLSLKELFHFLTPGGNHLLP